jgi:FlaA1/EpsC-like NDP-sugar epimerase
MDTDIRIASLQAIIKISPDKTANGISVMSIPKSMSEA